MQGVAGKSLGYTIRDQDGEHGKPLGANSGRLRRVQIVTETLKVDRAMTYCIIYF